MAGEPIVQFYIKNYLWNGNVVTTEDLFQTVPILGEPVITNPRVKAEMGKAGSFEFDMEMASPYYDALMQMKTIMRVTYFRHTIFRGRVLTIDKNLARTRTVHCEGDFAFLLDSHQNATKEDARPEIGVLQFLQQIITQHNADMAEEPDKLIALGEVPGQYTSATDATQRIQIPNEKAKQRFGDNSLNTSMDRLEKLLSDFGGFFRTRYNPDTGVTYLDWYDKYYNAAINTQTIEVSKNLIDLSGPTEVDNIFTVVIPVGKNNNHEIYINDYWPIVSASHPKVNYIKVPELATIPLYSDAELNTVYHRKADYQNAIDRFGWIWKPVNFENADTPEKLFAYAKDWIKNSFMPEITQWSVTALDMKILNSSEQVLLCGDRVNMIHPEVDQTYEGLSVLSAEYILFSPDKTKYTFGIPNQEINTSYGVKKNKSGGGGVGSGLSSNTDMTPNLDVDPDLEKLKFYLRMQYSRKTNSNEPIGLDDALAFVSYNTDGTEKDEHEMAGDYIQVYQQMQTTKRAKWSELVQEAFRRGVPVDDPQLLIDYTPELKNRQLWHKAQSEDYFINTVGLTQQEAEVLLNETAGQSWLAALVDDDGNWTQYAYDQGCMIWAKRDEMKQQAIDTRALLQGKREQKSQSIFDTLTTWLTGSDGINVGDYLSFDIDGKSFGLGEGSSGEIFNTKDAVDAVTGAVEKGIDMLSGGALFEEVKNAAGTAKNDVMSLFNTLTTSNEENTSTGTRTKMFSWLTGEDGLNLEQIENTIADTKKRSMTALSGLFSALAEDKPKTHGQGTWTEEKASVGGILDTNNTEDNKTEFSLESTTAMIRGKIEEAVAGLGAGSLDGWRVLINKATSYVSGGETYNVPAGSVAADDFHITATYDSLIAKLIVVDTLIAQKVDAEEIEADIAYVREINSETITAGTYLAAEHILASRISTIYSVGDPDTGYVDANALYGRDVLIGYHSSHGSSPVSLKTCFNSCTASESGGVITFTFTKVDGTTLPVNFNMADTQFYKDAISAARSAGRNDVYVNNISVNIGETKTGYLKYNDSSGTHNTGATFTVTGADVPSSSIQIGSYGTSSSGTPASNMRDKILDAINNGGWFSFTVTVDGTTASKTYSLDFR